MYPKDTFGRAQAHTRLPPAPALPLPLPHSHRYFCCCLCFVCGLLRSTIALRLATQLVWHKLNTQNVRILLWFTFTFTLPRDVTISHIPYAHAHAYAYIPISIFIYVSFSVHASIKSLLMRSDKLLLLLSQVARSFSISQAVCSESSTSQKCA